MSAVVKIKPGALGAHIRETRRANVAALKRAVRRATVRGVALLKKLTPVDEGVARAAWAPKSYSSGWTGIENSAPHIGILLKGARPHAVSREGIQAIRNWVIRKGLIRLSQPDKPRSARALRRSEAEGEFAYLVDDVVWAIVSKLKKYGYKGDDFVERSMPQLVAYVDTEVTVELAKSMAEPGQGGGE
jgi:hypothetical protein